MKSDANSSALTFPSHLVATQMRRRSHLSERIGSSTSSLTPPPPSPDEESQFELRTSSSAHTGAPLLISLQLRSDLVSITTAEVY